jgi:hypothetical protein
MTTLKNRVGGLGLIWNENRFTAGLKLQFTGTGSVPASLEPTVPLPYILRTVMTF